MRVLNLFSGIGGNRVLWKNCDVTSVEKDEKIASVYKNFFPQDEVIVGCANSYLENHYDKFDFIWSSPPCQSHGRYRHNIGVKAKGFKPLIPDGSLYGNIIFLKTYFKGLWVVENTKPYYEYLVKPTAIIQRHPFWSNFEIKNIKLKAKGIGDKNKISELEEIVGLKVSDTCIKNKRQVLRNCVDKDLGSHIYQQAIKQIKER